MADDNRALINELLTAIKHEHSIKKNGESWPEYIAKVITPGRIMWTLLAIGNVIQIIWLMGIQFRDVQVRLEASEARRRASSRASKRTRASKGSSTASWRCTVEDLMNENRTALATTSGASTTAWPSCAGDFNRTVQLQIVPRLDKIEKAQASSGGVLRREVAVSLPAEFYTSNKYLTRSKGQA